MRKWPNRIPPDLEKRLAAITNFRKLGPGDIWAEVRKWLEGHGTYAPESLPVALQAMHVSPRGAQHRLVFAVRAICRMLLVHPSGFYAWLREPFSQRASEDQRQTKLLQTAWEESGEAYGSPKLHDGLCDIGEDISPTRAWRLTRLAGIRAQIGYKKKPGSYGGCAAVVADNTLNREFDVPSR